MGRTWTLTVPVVVTCLLAQPGTASAQTGIPDKFGAAHIVGFAPTVADQASFAAQANAAGVRWTNEGLSWQAIEQVQGGPYQFAAQDAHVNTAINNGLQVMLQLGLTPQFYSSQPGSPFYYLYPTTSTAGLNAWSNFVTACVRRYKDRVKRWMIWSNMDDPSIWGPAPGGISEYLTLLARAHAAIKAEDPTAMVIASSADPAVLNALLDLGATNVMDAVSVHNYAEPFAPEVSPLLVLRLAAIRDVVQRRIPGKPILISEFGWPTAPSSPFGVSEGLQAAYLIRSNLLQGAASDILGTFWTDFQDQPVGGSWSPNQPEDNFGMLLRFNKTQKPSYNAQRAMATALAGSRTVGRRHPARAGILFTEGFETGRVYSPFVAGGASGSHTRTSAVSHTGNFSMRFDYSMTPAANSTYAVSPEPSFFIPVPGTPQRIRFWARGNGGPAPELTVGFRDAQGELYEAILGLVSGTDWREYSYTLDAPPGTSVLAQGSGDNIINYPIQFTGIGVHIWTVATPVTTGTLWVDDLVFEGGPSVFDLEFARPGQTVHALWSMNGSFNVAIPATATATYRDWQNNVFTFAPAGGQVVVPVGVNPAMLSITATTPTFTDVPFNNPFWAYIESVFRSGVTSGCVFTPPQYCPGAGVTRAEMAVFLVRARHGAAFVPPPATGRFADVAPTSPFAPFIEQLHSDGVTGGCATNPLRYCPGFAVTRDQMAVFLLRSEHGSLYSPPPATGVFADVPPSNVFAPWVERIYAEGVTGGCATGPLRYCPANAVGRDQMAVFLQRVFAFPLP